jgi:hypothetical protein
MNACDACGSSIGTAIGNQRPSARARNKQPHEISNARIHLIELLVVLANWASPLLQASASTAVPERCFGEPFRRESRATPAE